MKFKSDRQRKAVMSQLNKSSTSKFQDRMKKARKSDANALNSNKLTKEEEKRIFKKEGKQNLTIEETYVTRGSGNNPDGGQRDLKYKIREWGFIFSTREEAEKYANEHERLSDGQIVEIKQKEKKSKDNFKDKKEFSEKDVNLVKRRLNDGKIKNQNEIFGDAEGNFTNKELTKEQQQKGKEYLIDQWKTPNGVERKNNPMRYREQEILNNFDRIELKEYHDISRYGQKPYYVPLYQVYSKDGDSMEYYVDSNGVNIVG